MARMQCLPDSLVGREYYRPTNEGVEGRFRSRLEAIKAWKAGRAPSPRAEKEAPQGGEQR